ncbi:OPT family oligopeptide transporter [Streptomyces asiaticus]|uniref:OPT family oligopeptide transporter n=1 Tax=Streptomyces asiaticus TaxID=114695 RepID=UPI003F672EFE
MKDDGGREPAEMTARAVVTGFTIGLVLTAAITYLALYSGLAVSAAIPAALICTGVMGLMRWRGSLLENNLAQTVASSGEALAVGVIFTVPALVLSGLRPELDYWEVSLAAALGGALGVLCVIPLRRSLVRQSPELLFPESRVAAQVSRAGDTGRRSLRPALLALLGGAALKALSSFVGVLSGTVEGAIGWGNRVFYLGSDLSLALAGVGMIVGLRFASLMLLGGLISWFVALPLVADADSAPHGDLLALARQTWSSDIRFIGIGAMLVGGCWSIVQARRSIGPGLRIVRSRRTGASRTDDDLPLARVLQGIALATAATAAFMWWALGSLPLALIATVIVVPLVSAFAAVSGYVVGQVGSSNNPVSGLALSAFFLAALTFTAARVHLGPRVMLAILLISVFVCTATATAGDTAQHLATGEILGATPRRQQIAQIAGVIVFAFVVAPIVVLLQHGYGIGTGRPGSLQAPQAAIFANLATSLSGSGNLPTRMLWTGVAVGVTLVIADALLKRTTSSVRLSVMPVAIGMYLPFSLSIPLFLGGLLGWVLDRSTSHRSEASQQASRNRLMLLSSGVVTGEALVGLSVAVPRWADWPLPLLHHAPSALLSLAAFGACLGLIFHFSRRAGDGAGATARAANSPARPVTSVSGPALPADDVLQQQTRKGNAHADSAHRQQPHHRDGRGPDPTEP